MKKAVLCIALTLLAGLLLFQCGNRKEIAEAFYQKGVAFGRTEAVDSAFAAFGKALEADPRHVRANVYYQSLARYEFDQEEEIRAKYEGLAKKHPRDPVYQYLAANILDDYDKMKEKAESIIRIAPKSYLGYQLLGRANQSLGFDDDAVTAYEKAAVLEPAPAGSYASIGYIYLNSQEYDKAIDYLRKAVKADSSVTAYYPTLWRAQYMAASDSNREAVKQDILSEVGKVLEKNPHDLQLLSSLQYTYQSLGEAARADEVKKKIVELDSTGFYASYADYQKIYEKQTTRERLEAGEAFLKKYPKSSLRKYTYSMMFSYASNDPGIKPDAVEKIGLRWIEEFPKESSAYNSIAWDLYLKKPETYAKAVEYAGKGAAMAKGRSKGPILDTYGWALVKNGRYDEAVQALLEADSLYGAPDPEVYHHLGAAYLGAGDTEKGLSTIIHSLALKEDDEVNALFKEAYRNQFGSLEGAEKYLLDQVLAVSAVKEPYAAPDFTLDGIDGSQLASADHRGKVVLLNFWKPG